MEEVEAKLSVGSCTVRGVSSEEFREKLIYVEWDNEEYNKKIANARNKEEITALKKAKAGAILRRAYKHTASAIVKHKFPLKDMELSDYIGKLSEDDVRAIELAINRASSISTEEVRDLSQPSGAGKPPA